MSDHELLAETRRVVDAERHTTAADGDVTLTTITRLASHLTDENYEALLDAARHKSKRDVERLIATIDPRPDINASIENLQLRCRSHNAHEAEMFFGAERAALSGQSYD